MTIEIAPHPQFVELGGFGDLRLGRKKPSAPAKLKLAKYLDADIVIPATPPVVDYVTAVPVWPMYGNDKLGDCTWAAVGHMIEAFTASVGALVTPTGLSVETGYWETGTPPAATGTAGSAEDDGRDEISVLNYWRKQGVPGTPDKITAYAAVDPSNLGQVRAATWLFVGLYLGIALPLTAQGQQVWDVAGDVTDKSGPAYPGSWGGHAVPVEGFDAEGFTVITWGAPLKMTEAFFSAYVEEAYAIISPDYMQGGKAASGFDLVTLEQDLTSLTSGNDDTPEAAAAVLPAETVETAASPADGAEAGSGEHDAPTAA